MSEETFCLKWKTYSAHLTTAFRDIFNENKFSDVTLVCDDQTQLPAHKIVLSACSPVLGNILLNNPHPHPLLYLRGVKQHEMQSILQFMYLGEATILQDRINQFMEVAKELQVKELSREDTDEEEIRNNVDEVDENEDQDIINDIFVDETRSVSSTLDELIAFDVDSAQHKSDSGQVKNGKQDYICSDCGKGFAFRNSLQRHQKSKHEEGDIYSCNRCEYKATQPGNLKIHQQSKHEGVRYFCDQCEYQATRQEHLNVHKQSKH